MTPPYADLSRVVGAVMHRPAADLDGNGDPVMEHTTVEYELGTAEASLTAAEADGWIVDLLFVEEEEE